MTFVEAATVDLRRAIGSAYREIDLLREYRTRLIADVVTGKVDMREAAQRLPDEADEPDVLDEADALAENNGNVGLDGEDMEAVAEEVEDED